MGLGEAGGGRRWEKDLSSSHPHPAELPAAWRLGTGDKGQGRGGCWTRNTDWAGAGRCDGELMVQRRNEAPPPGGEDTGHLGKLGGRLGDKGEGW